MSDGPRTVLVTGATGFVGRRVIADLAARGWTVRAACRTRPESDPPERVAWLPLGDLVAVADWSPALEGADAVVHLAGRAHVMDDIEADPLAAYRAVNVDVTVALARAALKVGVRRLVYMSSVKAVGERSTPEGLDEAHQPAPEDAYGITKREAEVALLESGEFTGLGVTVLRPPLVYGPGVRANFARLLRLVGRGLPLPFGAVRNVRSLVYLGNLSDAVGFALETPALVGQACFVTDDDDVGTAELIRRIARAGGAEAHLLPVPVALLRGLFAVTGRGGQGERLLGSLRVRMDALTAAGWRPPFDMAEGLRDTVAGESG